MFHRFTIRVAALGFALFAAAAQAQASAGAETLIRQVSTEVIDTIKADAAIQGGDMQRIVTLVDTRVMPHVNFQRMTAAVVGRYWRQATPEQQKRLQEEFKTLLVRTYATAVSDYREAEIAFLPARELSPAVYRVRSTVDRGAGAPVLQVDYDVYKNAEAWKVFDVAINGVSLVVSYRSGFNNDIGKLGMDGLIDQITQHNVQKAAGG